MTFNTYFRASSHAMIACGAATLLISGGMSLTLAAVFAVVLVVAWNLEETRWQLSERSGLIVVLLALPLLYLDWKLQGSVHGVEGEHVGINALTHFIVFLSSVKLIQVKADRDWLFLYLISFFEVLLAAGLSISPRFLVALCLYMFCALSTIICFEMRKAKRNVQVRETRLLVATDSTLMRRLAKGGARRKAGDARRLPFVALSLLILIFALALPIFFIIPRFGRSALARSGGGLTGFVGFSNEVTLGDIGRLQQNDSVVMHVRVDEPQAARNQRLRWRGIALDHFSGRTWTTSLSEIKRVERNEHSLFQFDTTEDLRRLTTQTFFIEPIDTPVLFAAPRAIALQGPLSYVKRDGEGALSTRPHPEERISYRAYSDTEQPPPNILRADLKPYPREFARYLQLPSALDPRIRSLTREVILRAHASNRYDAARAIEAYFKQNYGYTLEMKASGSDPLADFLFRVRAGHCEYFSTAMAVMLRTENVPTRIVNGFQMGEYNDAADAYTVRQQDAHSWVEVYFPETDSWVSFDPTPAAGRPGSDGTAGQRSRLSKYAEALELLWIQYVVAYDKQEQRSLAFSLRNKLSVYYQTTSQVLDELRATLLEWWRHPLNGGASQASASLKFVSLMILAGALILALVLLARRVWRFGLKRGIMPWGKPSENNSVIVFYERMTKALASRGFVRTPDQTPLEFATFVKVPEALMITHAYNRVRYGAEDLSSTETARIEDWLQRIEEESKL